MSGVEEGPPVALRETPEYLEAQRKVAIWAPLQATQPSQEEYITQFNHYYREELNRTQMKTRAMERDRKKAEAEAAAAAKRNLRRSNGDRNSERGPTASRSSTIYLDLIKGRAKVIEEDH